MTVSLDPPLRIEDDEETPIDFDRTYTIDEFLDLEKDDRYEYELVRGKILARSKDPGPGMPHGEALGNIHYALKDFIGKNYATLGKAWVETSCRLQKTGTYVKPDVTYLPASELASLAKAGPITGLPSLMVEINSPSDPIGDIENKIFSYLDAGVAVVWSVYPARKYIEVYRPGLEKPEGYGLSDTLTLDEILPGFSLKLRDIFE